MSVPTPAVAAPTIGTVFTAMFQAAISGLALAPQAVNVVAVNLNSIQRGSNAINMYAQDIESDAEINHDIRLIALRAKRAAAMAELLQLSLTNIPGPQSIGVQLTTTQTQHTIR